jgi:hypothetical protein
MSVSLLQYNLDSPCWVHTLIIEGTCLSGMCHLTVTSFYILLTLLKLHQVFVIRSVSLLQYKLGSPYLVHTLIMEGTRQLNWPHFHGLPNLLNLCKVFVIRSFYLLPYNLGSLSFVSWRYNFYHHYFTKFWLNLNKIRTAQSQIFYEIIYI